MKAILVIDISDDVVEAYEDFTVDYDLRGTPKDDQKVNESIRYVEDCPLKPLPQKKVGDDLYERYGSWTLSDEKEASYRVGFNDCIDEIMGETE